MSNHKVRILAYLQQNGSGFCDDYLSTLLEIKLRQTTYAICQSAFEEKIIEKDIAVNVPFVITQKKLVSTS